MAVFWWLDSALQTISLLLPVGCGVSEELFYQERHFLTLQCRAFSRTRFGATFTRTLG